MQRRSRHKFLTTVLLLTVAIAFVCCNRKAIYSHYETIATNGWNRADTIRFDIKPSEESVSASGTINIRINDDYPFTTLTLAVSEQILPDGVCFQDTIQFSLIDDKGRSLGQGINLHNFQQPLHAYKFTDDQHLIVKVHHLMDQQLPGIINVGVSLQRH